MVINKNGFTDTMNMNLKIKIKEKSSLISKLNEYTVTCDCTKQTSSCRYNFINFVTILIFFILLNSRTCSAFSRSSWESKVGDSDSRFSPERSSNYETCINGEYLKDYTVNYGKEAGKYIDLGEVENFSECADLCCQEHKCLVALMLTSPTTYEKNCFMIDCYSPKETTCKAKSARHSRYHPYLFKRGLQLQKPLKVTTSGEKSFLANEKATCHAYAGEVCANYIDRSRMYYYTSNNDSVLDQRLRDPIKHIKTKLTGHCLNLALQTICYRFYPQCDSEINPKPIKICSNECDKINYGECYEDFDKANLSKYLKKIIPGCTEGSEEIDEESNPRCIDLKDFSSIPPPPDNFAVKPSTISHNEEFPENSNNTDSSQYSYGGVNTTAASSANISFPASSESMENSTAQPTLGNFSSGNAQISTHATVIDIPEKDDKGTDFEELETTTAKPASEIKEPNEEIRVSAGDDTVIKLPDNQVTLYASTWPKESYDGEYTYKWSQVSAPKESHGYIEGATTKNVKLSKLDIPGVYSFKLVVEANDKRHGVGYVNITVKDATHVNHPPRAEVYPKDQTITLPVNTVVLDASKSTDDVAIVSYKWEEIKGPIKENSVFASATDSKILQLRNLISGVYHFKLTVKDAEGEIDSTEATVTVKEEQDYPPEANAGNDVIVHLPNNTVTLNGSKSTDDKGKLIFEWSKSPDSPTADMQGHDKPVLHLSSLTEGTYVFNLKVTDTSGQSSDAKVKVIVLPEVNTKPVAMAGDDKELAYPDDSTTLDGSRSSDNSKITSYLWEQVSGPSRVKMIGANQAIVHITELKAGAYLMKLTVTDDKQLVGTDTVKIHVKKDHNENPTANAGKDQIIYLPTRSCVIDGRGSKDDEYIESYQWVRDGLSPAAGDVLNHSDSQAVLYLANLIKGKYMFDLIVTDNKGLTGKDTVVVTVKEDPNHMGLVELYLDVNVKSFTEENKVQLVRKLSVILEVPKENVLFQEVSSVGYGKGIMILFYVNDPNIKRMLDGKYVADILKQKIGFGGKLFEYKMQRAEPYICRNNCSDHGYCDETTKLCVCDAFWMGNFFKAHFGEKESNCEWSILYLSVVVFGIFLLFAAITWAVCFCFARRKRNKRRTRYRQLRSTEPDFGSDEILLVPKRMKERFSGTSLTFTESDDDSDDDNTVFDKKRVVNGKTRMNGNANGKVKYKDHAM